jgi:hypothetical protein
MKRRHAPSAQLAAKKQKVDTDPSDEPAATEAPAPAPRLNTPRKVFSPPAVKQTTNAKPLISKPASTTSLATKESEELFLAYEVYWTKRSNKKHKQFNDGILIIKNRTCFLKDMEGKPLGQTSSYSIKTLSDLKEGNSLEISSKEIEIVKPVPVEDYTSGRIFATAAPAPG